MNQEITCQVKLNRGGADTVWQCSWRGCNRFGARCGILVPTLGSRTALSERRMKTKDVSVVPAWKGLLWYARMSADKRALGMGVDGSYAAALKYGVDPAYFKVRLRREYRRTGRKKGTKNDTAHSGKCTLQIGTEQRAPRTVSTWRRRVLKIARRRKRAFSYVKRYVAVSYSRKSTASMTWPFHVSNSMRLFRDMLGA
jgi:hypothetical protein